MRRSSHEQRRFPPGLSRRTGSQGRSSRILEYIYIFYIFVSSQSGGILFIYWSRAFCPGILSRVRTFDARRKKQRHFVQVILLEFSDVHNIFVSTLKEKCILLCSNFFSIDFIHFSISFNSVPTYSSVFRFFSPLSFYSNIYTYIYHSFWN